MDFHSLTRRELQTLCKKKKIPANMTNVAMADALQALQTVEGLEEFLTQSETQPLQTPAKTISASGITRTTNRRKTVKEEPESSKLTTTARRGAKIAEEEIEKEDMPDAAASSVCTKLLVAPITQRNTETSHFKEGKKSTTMRVNSTRRSTRLLEKKMNELSLKQNEGTVDDKASLEKDSQDLQRQFSEDLEDSQVLEVVPENKIFSDESNVTTEVKEESSVVIEVPGQNMVVLLKKGELSEDGIIENKTAEPVNKNDDGDLENASKMYGANTTLYDSSSVDEVEESINENECKSYEHQAVKEDAEQLDEASDIEVSSDEFETQNNLNVIDGAQDAASQPISVNEEVVFLGSECELKTTENDGIAIAAENDFSLSGLIKVIDEIQQGIDNTQEAIPKPITVNREEISGSEADKNANEDSGFPAVALQTSNTSVDYANKVNCVSAECEDSVSQLTATKLEISSELNTESDNDGDNNQDVDQLVQSICNNNENLCPVNILLDMEFASESLLAGDVRVEPASPGYVDPNNCMANTGKFKICESAETYNKVEEQGIDNISNKSTPFKARTCKSSSKKSPPSVHQMVHDSDKKENIEVNDRKTVTLQDENASAVYVPLIDKKTLMKFGTPIDKKSLRQLRKLVKQSYQQQAEERRALQTRVEN